MTLLFISQPMNGLSEDEIRTNRKRAAKKAAQLLPDGEEIRVLDTYFTFDAPGGTHFGLYFLAKSLEYLAVADAIYFAKGWETARGCRIEHRCAIDYGIDVLGEET